MQTFRRVPLAAVLTALVLASGAHAVPPLYVATPIPTLGGGANDALAINAAGHVVGSSYITGNGGRHAYLFAGGVSIDVGFPGNFNEATGINRHAQVVGNGDGAVYLRGYVQSGGTVRDVGTPDGYASAYGINDRGQIVGQFTPPGGAGKAYMMTDGTYTDLGSLESWGGSHAYAINNAGQVAGYSYVGGGFGLHAFLYENGTMFDLAPPGVPLNSQGFALNAQGQVAGGGQIIGGSLRGFIATNKVMAPLPPLAGGTSSKGLGINTAGQVVGSGNVPNAAHGFLYDDGYTHDLNALVVSGLNGLVIVEATAINDSGQIAAIACEPVYGVCTAFRLDPLYPGLGTLVANPYGTPSMTGGTLAGNTFTVTAPVATLQLGNTAGTAGSPAVIDFAGLNVGPNTVLTIRSGASGQSVVLNNVLAKATSVVGVLVAEGGNGAEPPALIVRNARGIAIATEGRIVAPAGLTLDALGATWQEGEAIVNFGVVDGGARLRMLGGAVNGAGTFKGNAIEFATFGNLNNPVKGAHYLANGLTLMPSTPGLVEVTVNDYGRQPQFINLAIKGDGSLAIPSAWPNGAPNPPNNAPVAAGGFRAAGVPDPVYGGSSIIVQATGMLMLDGQVGNDLVFPGGIALKAGTYIDFNGVAVNNGWTTSGKPFQGQFYEAPNITSSGPIAVRTSDLNWINFSQAPLVPVRTWQLQRLSNGSAQFATADGIAPHVNTYSVLIEAAANGQCWVCLMNTNPANLY